MLPGDQLETSSVQSGFILCADQLTGLYSQDSCVTGDVAKVSVELQVLLEVCGQAKASSRNMCHLTLNYGTSGIIYPTWFGTTSKQPKVRGNYGNSQT